MRAGDIEGGIPGTRAICDRCGFNVFVSAMNEAANPESAALLGTCHNCGYDMRNEPIGETPAYTAWRCEAMKKLKDWKG